MRFEDIDWSVPPPPGGYDVTPAVNAKCLVFTLALSLGYWKLPPKNKYVLLALCFFPYLWISYYDVAYGAKRNLGPSFLADIYDVGKVPSSKQIRVWKSWAPKWKSRVQLVDAVVVLAAIALLPRFLRWTPTQPPCADSDVDAERKRRSDNIRAAYFIALSVAVCAYCRFRLHAE